MGLHVEIITEFDEFVKIEHEWQDLLERSHFNCFTASHPWLCLWWRCFQGNDQLSVITIHDGEKLVAAAPLKMGKSRFRGLPVKSLSFLSNHHVPQIDFLVDKRLKDGYTVLLNVVVKIDGWQVFQLENVKGTSPLWQEWPAFFQWSKFLCGQKQGLSSPLLEINRSYEEYYSGLSKKFRKVMRNKNNRIEKEGKVHIEEVTRESDLEKVTEELLEISAKSWKAKEKKDLLADPQLNRFFTELTPLALKMNWLKLWLLKLDEKAIAFEYHLLYQDEDCALRADFDEEYRQVHPGSYLDAKIIQRLFDLQVKRYNMAGSDDFYKLNWTKNCLNHLHGFIFRPTIYGRLLLFLEFSLIPFLRKNIILRSPKKNVNN